MADYVIEIGGRLYYQRRIPASLRDHPELRRMKNGMIKIALGLSASERSKARSKVSIINGEVEKRFESYRRELHREPRWIEDMTVEQIHDAIIGGLAYTDFGNERPQTPAEFLDSVLRARNMQVPPSLAAKIQHAVPAVAALEEYASLGNPFNGSTPTYYMTAGAVKRMYEQWSPPPKPRRAAGLGELIRQYLAEPKRKSMDMNARRGYGVAFAFLTDVLGEFRDVSTVGREDIKRVREVILSMIPRAKSYPEFRDLKYQEIAAILDTRREDDDSIPTLKASVTNKYLNRITALFRYAVTETYLTATPADDLSIPASESRRTSFTLPQLRALFTAEYRLDGLNWLPVLSLFQGCRANELAQLDVTDVIQESEHWCLRITDQSEFSDGQDKDKTIKTAASRRVIPLHRRVVNLGFIEYVHQRKQDGFRKVFPASKYSSGNYWDSIRDDVYDLLDRAGVRTDTTTYHSFATPGTKP